jgi:hypothetical protein
MCGGIWEAKRAAVDKIAMNQSMLRGTGHDASRYLQP